MNTYLSTGCYLCSFGSHLCLHLSHQEAERGLRNRGAENEVPFRVQKENAKHSQFELWLQPVSRAALAHTVIRASALVLKKILFCVSNYHRLVPFLTSNKNEY